MKARIYANLNKGLISIKQKTVVDHVSVCEMINVKFIVNPAGCRTTIEQGQRNVHAFAAGTITHTSKTEYTLEQLNALRSQFKRISYNPFRSDRFEIDGKPIEKARKVLMVKTELKSEDNRVLCQLFLIEE